MTDSTHELVLDANRDGRDGARDSLELYFRKMTEYPLLTHAEEVALARRLEKADLAIARALLGCAEGRQALLRIASAIRRGEQRVEDVERSPARPPETAPLADRLTALVTRAETHQARAQSRPRAYGLRLHPRAVRAIERELSLEAPSEGPPSVQERELIDARRDIARERRAAERATEQFVQANLRIVVTFARRCRGLPLVDLIQEGNLGLLRAIDKFDHRRGLRFSTYAAWWIRHSLGRALADQSKMIRLPVHLTGTLQRLRRAEEHLRRERGRDPSVDELAERMGIPADRVARALDVVAQPLSLDTPVSADRDATELGELVVDPAATPIDDAVANRELHAHAHELLQVLPEREAEVIRLRFGIDGTHQRTLEEVGARLSLSRERARQLEREALRKLRAASERRGARTPRPARRGSNGGSTATPASRRHRVTA